MALTVIAAYDIRVDDRRARLAALLQAYGDRIQKSVFVLEVDEDELRTITTRSLAIIDPATDSVWFARQYVTCWAQLGTLGQTKSPEKVLFWSV